MGMAAPIVVDPVSSNNWQRLNVGAGGFIDGIDVAPDGTMVVRTDTYGAYIWNGTEWQQLVTSTSMPAAFVTPNLAITQGVYEIQIAPSNSNIMYMMYEGYVFKSTNQGTTWTRLFCSGHCEPKRCLSQGRPENGHRSQQSQRGLCRNAAERSVRHDEWRSTWQSVSAVPVSQTDGNGEYPGITGIDLIPL